MSDQVEISLDRFNRLLVALESLVECQRRTLAQHQDNARRAAAKAGATTDQAMRDVEAKLRKKGIR